VSKPHPIICDWLDLTYAPDCAPWPTINRMLLNAGFDAESSDRTTFMYRLGRATVMFGPSRGTMRVSFSGSACAALREQGSWSDLLFELGSTPHHVTRVDAALDLSIDGADMVDLMRKRYPSGQVNLGRKAVSTSVVLSVRPDGRETGTWYAGRLTKARFTARVYDKAWEALQKRGELLPPRTRVEVTAKGGDSGATLRDAEEPAALFWHLASPALLDAPEGVPVWTPNREMNRETGWIAPTKHFDPAALLKRRVESFAMLDALALVADDLGPYGREYLLGLIEKRLRPSEDITAVSSSQGSDQVVG
jgi:hypothetical protein